MNTANQVGIRGPPDFNSKPVLVFWETTRACLLSCKHCRASAIRTALPGELSKEEGFGLLDQISGFGSPSPVVILTGGDPLMRSDIFELTEYAKGLGIKFALSPAVSEKLTHEMLMKLRDSGATSISVSLDGSDKATHDSIRQVDGTFDRTIEVIRDSVNMGLGIQVNTTVMKRNLHELPEILHLIKGLGVRVWEVFFLIKVGRGTEVDDISQEEYESVCNFLYDASRYGVVVRTVEAPFIRRVAKTRLLNGNYWKEGLYDKFNSELTRLEGEPTQDSTIAPRGTLDGDGIVFVAYDGTVYPGGFIPVAIGNVRSGNLVNIYRENKLMKDIRSRNISGFCGKCDLNKICGGSRARAYAATGDPLASDDACVYEKLTKC
ncbi:MAG: TIGR04053 family radical SAM/SPASM domain-containing protein [Candidatus Marsarchaeota archaeon]|nr:TIGR04053 family radical SAM/SPASM domain-containing protein [Candidatus Marsarchaeota archaeon]